MASGVMGLSALLEVVVLLILCWGPTHQIMSRQTLHGKTYLRVPLLPHHHLSVINDLGWRLSQIT